MPLGILAGLALVLTISLYLPALGQKKSSGSDSIKLPFETYKLPNGLTVIFFEDHARPTVAVNVWYHVGSKNEMPGRTGFAHLFEHVMFTGSGHVPYVSNAITSLTLQGLPDDYYQTYAKNVSARW